MLRSELLCPSIGPKCTRCLPTQLFCLPQAAASDLTLGFFEIDMVELFGGIKTDGDSVRTLTLTDIASGWTECVFMWMRNQMLVIETLDLLAAMIPDL